MEQPSSGSNSRHSSRHSSKRRSHRSDEGNSHHRPRPRRQEGQRFECKFDEQDDNHRRRRHSKSASNRQINEHRSHRSQSSPGSTASRDPEGEYDDDDKEGCELSRENVDVEQYASTARKKASLMTNHDFNNKRRSDSNRRRRSIRTSSSNLDGERRPQTSPSRRTSDDNGGNDDGGNIQNYFEEQAQGEPFPPPKTTSMVGQYIPSSAHSAATSVSSMTSKDSYVREQLLLRDLARYKRALHESGRHFNLICEEAERWDAEDEYGEEEEIVIQKEYEDEEENSMFGNKSNIHQFCETGEGDGLKTSFSVTSSDDDDDDYQDYATYSISSRGGNTRPTLSISSRNNASSTRSAHMHKPRSTVGSPVYQLEECCIKHPHLLLQDQTNVNVWTCMRYCKDHRTGRWVTVKKVCTQCLRELGDSYDDEDWLQHASLYDRSRSTRTSGQHFSHSTEKTWTNSSDDEEVGHANHHRSRYNLSSRGATVSVYGDDGNQTPLEREAEAQRRRFIRRLAARAYHFPGNTWFEDWLQYTKNTHLVFGIFFHHPLHPVTGKERCIILLGSVAVGLLMSNLIYLWFVEANFGMHDPVLSLGPDVAITKLMITLWTLGSFVHTIFDLCVWHIKACTLCRVLGGHVSDRAVKCGRSTGVTIVMSTLAFATYLVLLRASEDFKATNGVDSNEAGNIPDDSFFHSVVLGGGAEYFDFLLGYFIEFILAVFVYNPLILTVVFTGVLGCDGRIPVLGGRPREVAKEQRYAMKRQRYTMPQTLKLGDNEYEADMWCDQKLATNF